MVPDVMPTTKTTFHMAWPLGLKAIMVHGIILIDTYLVAPLGEEALAAMGLAGALAGLLLGIIFAFSTATQIRIAQAFGSAGPRALKSSLFSGLAINLMAIAIGLLIVAFAAGPTFVAFAQTAEIAAMAQAYLSVFLVAVLAEAVAQCLSSHFNGCGRTRVPLVSYVVSLPVNVVVSIVLIHGMAGMPSLGVVGAAYGTVAASVIRVLFLAAVLWVDNRAFASVEGWSGGSFRGALGQHFQFSWPIAATFVSMTIGTQVCVLIYARMSVTDFVALTLVMPWVQVLGTIGMAWAQAVGITMAQLLGRQAASDELDRYLSAVWRAAFVAAGLVALCYLAFCLASGWIYAELSNETVRKLWTFLPVLLLLPFPKGSNAICGQTLRAAGDTVYVMNIFNVGQWLFKVPVTAFLVLYLDVAVVWVLAVFLLEELVKFPLFHQRLFEGSWRNRTVSV